MPDRPAKDPVAARSAFLCMYMRGHPDTLVAYVKHYAGVQGAVADAAMRGIDAKGMTLAYARAKGAPATEVRVPFDPPLGGYDEVKPRLLAMKADAEAALGMTKAPAITTFRLPLQIYQPTLLLALLVYTTLAAPHTPGALLREWLGARAMRAVWVFVPAVHCLEGAWMAWMCRRARTPLGVGVLYVLAATLWGYPVLFDFRARVHEARIASITKGE
ncbi:hypothetical protein GLOTRDRAFT_131318 [Gloeophyllum trabeum ATCC 11539]|uniref:DUF2470 domain-containing protein n=1 Tax=Gloeophyllum trabeum (strain ATCC 11539 / FP-39264 / Madison 617) TaxID=670483 RepID=S7Q0M7_GLOTA|nr:uncharacterized protein GLOTRDRAFT_131318 [Gloeophyllum trabeum ATCC 11539]EPQ53032.1 hypothetical protein GLOTRDRAFT_131318 [Gloeophyllum trabeum ATCC 11539]